MLETELALEAGLSPRFSREAVVACPGVTVEVQGPKLPSVQSVQMPPVSVIVCTRNRSEGIVLATRSIQRCKFRDFELLIIDQSDDDETERALLPLCSADQRLRYLRMDVPGKPGALNRGFGLARGKYLLLTDDDCEVSEGWIDALLAAFEADPRVGCVYGEVTAGPFDPAQGYIPECRIEQAHTIYRLRDLLDTSTEHWSNFGIGASMALRADVVAEIGGCDPCIGPGAKFRTGDDIDIAVQVLRLGYAVHFLPAASVVHHGFRYWSSSKADVERSGFALGAIFMKHLRCGTFFRGTAVGVVGMVWTAAKRAVRGQRPLGTAFPIGWASGAAAALAHRVDQRSNQFVTLGQDQARAFAHHVGKVVAPSQRRVVSVAARDEPVSARPQRRPDELGQR